MDPELEARPAFLFFKGAANGLFAEGADRLTKGVNDQQALLIGIRCERGSHRFFKKYGERFEDSEGKQIFMEFADEEKQHLELLIREYKSLVNRKGRRRPARQGAAREGGSSKPAKARRARQRLRLPYGHVAEPEASGVIDLHLHTTASDGLCDPAVLVDRRMARRHRDDECDRPRHRGRPAGSGSGGRGVGDFFRPRYRDHGRARWA